MENVITDGGILSVSCKCGNCTFCEETAEIVSDLSLYTTKEVAEWIGSGTKNSSKCFSTSKLGPK